MGANLHQVNHALKTGRPGDHERKRTHAEATWNTCIPFDHLKQYTVVVLALSVKPINKNIDLEFKCKILSKTMVLSDSNRTPYKNNGVPLRGGGQVPLWQE